MSAHSSRSTQSIVTSTTSHMSSASNNTEEMLFEQWRDSFFFPLFTEISRRGHLPKIIYIIQIIILFLQELGVTMWCGSSLINNSSFETFIYYFTDWNIVRTKDFKNCVIQYSIGFGIFLFSNLVLTGVGIYYHYKRIFLDSQIIILRFLFYPLLDTILPFYACLVGRSFVEISGENSNGLSISFFIVSLIIFIISIIELIYCKQFSTNTPVIDRSLLGSWDDLFLSLTISSICYGSLLSTMLDMFPKWLHIPTIIGYIVLVWYRIYYLYFIPMLRFFVNSIFCAICIMCILNLILSLVHLYVSLPSYVCPVVAVVFFIGGLFLSIYLFDRKKKKLLNVLSYKLAQQTDFNEESAERLIRDRFDQIVFSSANDAISYLRVGVAYHADLLIDISFPRYLMEVYPEPSIIFAVSKVASFFASDPQFLSYCLSAVTRIPGPTLAQNYLIYQIRRIHAIRQSSVSVDASNLLVTLQKMSRETISQVRGFWSEIQNAKTDISFSSLQYLRKITLKTDSAFIDARDRFPNSVSILNEYCRFQIEAMGDFSGAINSGKKIMQLNQGENLMIDHAFRSLVNVYPNYLLKNVMNTRGDLLKKDIMMSDSFETMSSITSYSSISTNSSSSSQIEFEEKYEEVISQLFNHGKLRVSLQSRMKSMRLLSLTKAQTWSFIQLLCCILVYLILIIYVPTLCKRPNDVINCANGVSQMTLNMYQVSSIAAIQHVITLRRFSGVSVLKQLLGIKNSDLNTEPSLMTKPFTLMKNISYSLKEQYEDLIELLMGPLSSLTGDFPEFYENNEFYQNEQGKTINLSLRSSIAVFISDAELVSSYGDNPSTEKTKKMTELMINVKEISNKMKQFQKSIGSVGESIIKSSQKTFSLVSILIVAICFTVFMFFRILNIVSMFSQKKKASDVLRKTNPEMIKQSFMPIAKIGENETICGNNIHNAHEVNFWMRMYPIVVILSILIAFAFVLSSIIIFKTELTKAKDIFELLYEGTVRFSGIMNSLITFCSYSAGMITKNEANELLSDALDLLGSSQESIDMELMGTNNEIDSFYFTQECNRTSVLDDFSEYVKCLSVDNKINAAYSSIKIFSMQNMTGKLNDHNFASLVFIVDMFLAKDLFVFQDLLVRYSEKQLSTASFYLISLSIAGLLISFLIFLIEQMFSRTFMQSVDAIKQLIAMLPPVQVVTSSILMNFLNNNAKSDKYETLTSALDSIISETTMASILVDHHLLIQAVNNAVNTTTGFTPDQILGQKIDWLIPFPQFEENSYDTDISINSKFYSTIQMMLNDRKGKKKRGTNLNDSNNNNININNNSLANAASNYSPSSYRLSQYFSTTNSMSNFPGNSFYGNGNGSSISKFMNNKSIQSNDSINMFSNDNSNNNNNITLNNNLNMSMSIANINNPGVNNNDSSSSSSSIIINNYNNGNQNDNNDNDEDEELCVVLLTKCLTENGSLIPAKTTILRMKDESKGRPQVVLFIRDLSQEVVKERELEEAKNRTEALLKSIIPKQIEDIASEFTAPSATFIMMEVSGLTDYVHTMSPQNLMSNLKVIYDTFNKKVKEYPAVSLLKTDSEIIVACCGLFDKANDLTEQVSQSICYCRQMIGEIEVINEELDIDLHLRIAINVGGPVLGKMLNEKTPSFEIVGSFIELAEKIIIEGENDVVQVGEPVVQYLDNKKFEATKGTPIVNSNGITEQIYTISDVYI